MPSCSSRGRHVGGSFARAQERARLPGLGASLNQARAATPSRWLCAPRFEPVKAAELRCAGVPALCLLVCCVCPSWAGCWEQGPGRSTAPARQDTRSGLFPFGALLGGGLLARALLGARARMRKAPRRSGLASGLSRRHHSPRVPSLCFARAVWPRHGMSVMGQSHAACWLRRPQAPIASSSYSWCGGLKVTGSQLKSKPAGPSCLRRLLRLCWMRWELSAWFVARERLGRSEPCLDRHPRTPADHARARGLTRVLLLRVCMMV